MSNVNNYTDYNLPQNAYITFDALSLKDYIVSRLNTNEVFTDQIYEGSNMSQIIDIVAFSYHVLMFYLNTTASESTFSQATLYENMNKIVNLIGYKPTGRQTSLCNVNATANSSLAIGNYVIRRYSYFLVDGIQYTFLKDYSFAKTTSLDESIESLNENVILYQGTVQEYPTYTAEGNAYETLPIVVTNIVDTTNEQFISHGSIAVYVKEKSTDRYYTYTEVDNLYIANSYDRVFDLRLNENGNYEVKFGNGTFGRQLDEGDEVVIYYILSDNVAGVISQNAISGNTLFTYTTTLFESIYADTKVLDSATLITNSNNSFINFSNPNNSTAIGSSETVDEIRQNAPRFLASNLRLLTSQDFTQFITKSLNSITQSIYVASNKEYLDEYINYFYAISVDPNKENRVLINQVNFADSCDFNNVNVFCVPQLNIISDNQIPDYLSSSFKNLIVDITKSNKALGMEVVPRDPVYVTLKIGITNKSLYNKTIADTCKLVIVRENTNKIQKETLKNKVITEIKNFLDPGNNSLGGTIAIRALTSNILSIEGIKSIRTVNTAENITFQGVSFVAWNPSYEDDDISLINQDTTLPFFKFPYLNYPIDISNYIEVIDE